MPHIHEVATVTSKGQITLPKPIRQALGIGVGGKVAFDLRGSDVVVSRADEEHEDPRRFSGSAGKRYQIRQTLKLYAGRSGAGDAGQSGSHS